MQRGLRWRVHGGWREERNLGVVANGARNEKVFGIQSILLVLEEPCGWGENKCRTPRKEKLVLIFEMRPQGKRRTEVPYARGRWGIGRTHPHCSPTPYYRLGYWA